MSKQQMISQFVKKTVSKAAVFMAALLMAFPLQIIGAAAPAAAIALVASDEAKFVYITSSVQHFGDDPDFLTGTFRGDDHEFIFDAPGVNPNLRAVLMLQTRNVGSDLNIIRINNVNITGALVKHDNGDEWFAQIGEIPSGTLKATGNILKIISRNSDGNAGGNLDDFNIDNVVALYRQQ
jgi:hypothetical protein